MDTNQNAGVNLLFTNAANGQTIFAGDASNEALYLGYGYINTSQATVPAANNGRIQDFGLTLSVSNPSGAPITATLTTPGGKTVTLFSGITTTSLDDVTFSDGAAADAAQRRHHGDVQARPVVPRRAGGLLNALESGGYTLTIYSPTSQDSEFFDLGTLVNWSVDIGSTGPDRDADDLRVDPGAADQLGRQGGLAARLDDHDPGRRRLADPGPQRRGEHHLPERPGPHGDAHHARRQGRHALQRQRQPPRARRRTSPTPSSTTTRRR